MLFLLAIFFLIRHAASTDVETITWFSAPNFRGTWDLIVSCVLTLTICVWSALHLNVPTEDSTLKQRNLRRTRWILLGIFAPELVVSTAFAQFLTAKWLKREISLDVKYRKAQGVELDSLPKQQLQEWGTIQCYFAVMGGITVQAGGDCFEGDPRLSLTPEGVRLLSFLGRLPPIHENQIRDKSKADGLAKTLVCLQAGWMIVQTIARLNAHLPVTLLEINTIGHVLCALVLYLLWWSKPLEVKDPVLIPHEDWMDPYLALMWMCSLISSCKDDEVTEMRCMAYTPPSQRGVVAPTITVEEERPAPPDTLTKSHETHFSVGSTGARDPVKFIGPLGPFRVGSHERTPSPSPYDHNVIYEFKDTKLKTAPEHEIFFQLQEPHHGLKHTRGYCRRAFSDCHKRDALSQFAINRWLLANKLIDDLWAQCENRPSYMDFFFTTSTLGLFVGEANYIDTHVANFLGLSYLGSVNIHKDRLKSVLAFAAAAYGALHIAAWHEYFPTRAERYLWITSSLAIGSSGIFFWLYFLIKERIESVDVIGSRLSQNWILSKVTQFVFVPLFVMARVYLVVEGFVSLRRVPESVYQTPEWSDYFPHL
ncbi:hypothetical protein K505DRAFT_357038 [Melanomma pulvis-pyrius CBS 109.77]|uniref:Integral membrane protein n=1 Tax=Melanomma pulvis-pyrius CBS 109.77 TaxID=1314802 RepID=A0A6A6XQX2_9PLEO|nr:hypothetical protein K505DRAFT_357038 [Melanomma pulvis-pyrius CBS 109.77]